MKNILINILKLFYFFNLQEGYSGDIEEEYFFIQENEGKWKAKIWLWVQVFRSIPIFFKYHSIWSFAMFLNYLKTTFRSLKKNTGYSFINIFGLAIGMACCIIILFWVHDELSFDRFHKNSDNLYRIVEKFQFTDGHEQKYGVAPDELTPILKNNYPEIKYVSRFLPGEKMTVQYKEKIFNEKQIAMVDPTFLEIFTFPLMSGDFKTALSDPNSILISERMTQKYFEREDVVGQVLTLNQNEKYQITGVLKNIPQNSHLKFDFLVPYVKERRLGIPASQNILFYTYVQLKSNATVENVNEKIKDIFPKYFPETPAKVELSLQSLKRIHLYSNFDWDFLDHGDITYVIFFIIIAGFVLLIACVNFMNLSTARSGKRAKEIGMRKVLGGKRTDLIRQFYGEAFFLSFLSLLLALLFVYSFLPFFNQLTGKQLFFQQVELFYLLPCFLGIVIFTAILAGSYPALVLSSLQPIKSLQGIFKTGKTGVNFRIVLVIFQFTLSSALIIGTVIIYQQLTFMQNKKLGYDKDQVVYIPLDETAKGKYNTLKITLDQNPKVEAVTIISELPTSIERATDYMEWTSKVPDQNVLMRLLSVDEFTKDVFQFEIIKGRFLSSEYGTDAEQSYIINETAAKIMDMENPIGQRFSMWNREGTIIGVVADFHFMSMHQKIEPLIMKMMPGWTNYLCLRISTNSWTEIKQDIQNIWESIIPNQPFEIHFLNQNYENLYLTEKRISLLFQIFSGLAILISCLGLFGLTAFAAEQRTKEIGVRKLLGASVSNLTYLVSKDFLKLVLLANIIALPFAYFLMKNWLDSFAYRINLGITVFLISIAITIIIALITVIYQAIKTALTNPVMSLKYE